MFLFSLPIPFVLCGMHLRSLAGFCHLGRSLTMSVLRRGVATQLRLQDGPYRLHSNRMGSPLGMPFVFQQDGITAGKVAIHISLNQGTDA